MQNAKTALIWITDILKKYHIPFQISGGLAAIAYGATRPLADIDIDIPDNKFDLILDQVRPYLVFGPEHWKGDKWDLLLMTLNYQGQEIDISGADTTHVFDIQSKKWVKLNEDLLNAPIKNVMGMQLPVIPCENLIHYKKMLSRDVDLIDIEQINNAIKSIFFIENPSEKDHGAIFHGINAYAAQRGMSSTGGYFFVAYDEDKKIIAAISGFNNFGPAEIGGLWVDEKYRNQGYGSALVEKAKEWAKTKGCKAITVFTLKDWPAYEWYLKLGFKVEFERKGHANNSIGCYLSKHL